MKKKFVKFIIRLTVISVIAEALTFLLKSILPPGVISPALPWLIVLFYFITAAVHSILLKISVMNPRRFVGYFMLATFLKLFIYLIVMVVYVFNVKEGMLAFVLAFFGLYIIYTVFEVMTILNQTKELS